MDSPIDRPTVGGSALAADAAAAPPNNVAAAALAGADDTGGGVAGGTAAAIPIIVRGPDEPDCANGREGGFCAPVAERGRGGGSAGLDDDGPSDGITLPAAGVAASVTDPLADATGIDVLRGPAGTDPSALGARGADVITLPPLGGTTIAAADVDALRGPAEPDPSAALVARGADVITLPPVGVVAMDAAGIEVLVPPDAVVAGVSERIVVLREPTGTDPLALVAPVADENTLPAPGVAALGTAPLFGVAAGIDVLRGPAAAAVLGAAAGIDELRGPAGVDPLVAPELDLIPALFSLAVVAPRVAPDVAVLGAAAAIDVLREPAGAGPFVAPELDLIPALFSLGLGAAAAIDVLREPAGTGSLVAPELDLIPAELSLAAVAPEVAELTVRAGAALEAAVLGAAAAIPMDVLREAAGTDALVAPDGDGFVAAGVAVPRLAAALEAAVLGAAAAAGRAVLEAVAPDAELVVLAEGLAVALVDAAGPDTGLVVLPEVLAAVLVDGAEEDAGTAIAGLDGGALDAGGLGGRGGALFAAPALAAVLIPLDPSLFAGIVTFAVAPVVEAFATVAAMGRDVVRATVGPSGSGVGSATDCLTSLASCSSWATGVCWSCSHSCSSIASISTTELVSLWLGGGLVIAWPRRRDPRGPRTLPSRSRRCAPRFAAPGCRRRTA